MPKTSFRLSLTGIPTSRMIHEQMAEGPTAPGREDKVFIYIKESTTRTDAINTASGACGLGQALPCSKLSCCLIDYECQDKWFSTYAMQRYGSWAKAKAFWLQHHWW